MAKVITFPSPTTPKPTRPEAIAQEMARLLGTAAPPRQAETLKLLREINGKLDRLLP